MERRLLTGVRVSKLKEMELAALDVDVMAESMNILRDGVDRAL